ncbi:xylan 1,4-beta-xylosidase [Lactobacillus sp. S2-2]|uniref:DUF6440 family protein n=1 Tax=Lactobacillus sp. S2-2 TaxID=2692917 RepID=UPI001F1A362E|nr:DUF6440 family protein [Lactobacillus sp. S2-2]MCF6515529.1 xylan 1,4-beta-xylosidase [Lactobacillus sp. S2-2]
MKKSKDKRFIQIRKEKINTWSEILIIVDKETGVEYSFSSTGFSNQLIPVLDRNGLPKINKEYDPEKEKISTD